MCLDKILKTLTLNPVFSTAKDALCLRESISLNGPRLGGYVVARQTTDIQI